MGYIRAKCDGCSHDHQFDGCLGVILEFEMPHGKPNIFIQADWDGNKKDGYLASFIFE